MPIFLQMCHLWDYCSVFDLYLQLTYPQMPSTLLVSLQFAGENYPLENTPLSHSLTPQLSRCSDVLNAVFCHCMVSAASRLQVP